jgi:hypothetical protein
LPIAQEDEQPPNQGGKKLRQIPSLGHCKRFNDGSSLAEGEEAVVCPLMQDLLSAANYKDPRDSQGVEKLGGHNYPKYFGLLDHLLLCEGPQMAALPGVKVKDYSLAVSVEMAPEASLKALYASSATVMSF